jgi:8-oxo-dGTP pyrophosphatase MutT (NUDIX family)
MTSNITDKQTVEEQINVAGAVIMKLGEQDEPLILLIQRSAEDHWPLHWEIPRGKCDQGVNEKTTICLKREVKEETGLDVIPIEFIDKFTYIAKGGTRESTQYNYLCKMKNPNQPIKLSKEHQDHQWITSVGEVELMTQPETKKTISKVLNRDERIVDYPINDFSDDQQIEEIIDKLLGKK